MRLLLIQIQLLNNDKPESYWVIFVVSNHIFSSVFFELIKYVIKFYGSVILASIAPSNWYKRSISGACSPVSMQRILLRSPWWRTIIHRLEAECRSIKLLIISLSGVFHIVKNIHYILVMELSWQIKLNNTLNNCLHLRQWSRN